MGAALIGLGLAACGGSVDDEDGGNRNGVATCSDCPDGMPKQEPGPDLDRDAGVGVPVDPTPAPEPIPTPLPTPAAPGAIALRYADFPPPSSGSSGGTGGAGGFEIDPNTLYVMIGSSTPLCDDPFAYAGCGSWKVSIGIPPELVKPGLLKLDDPRLISSFSSSGPDRGGGDCSGGGGSFVEGTIEIVALSMSGQTLEVRLADTWTFDYDVNGTYTAAFCN